MEKSKLKKGTIVVVKDGISFGNDSGTVTKVLSRPGRLADHTAEICGRFHLESGIALKYVMCKAPDTPRGRLITCNNAPAFMESISDLRLATEEEKRLFIKNKRKPLII